MSIFDYYMEQARDKWIQDAIKKPGALRKKMGKDDGQKLTIKELDEKKKQLEKGGVTKSEGKTIKQINLAKTLKRISNKRKKQVNESVDNTITEAKDEGVSYKIAGTTMEKVSGSHLDSVGYNKQSGELKVVFKTNDRFCYTFKDVPESIYHELMNAPSKGRYFNKYIRPEGTYEFSKRKIQGK